MQCTNSRKGTSLTYKFLIIILVLTLFPAILMAFSSINTFNSIKHTFQSATEDIQTTTMQETNETRTAAINRTRQSITNILKVDLQTKRDDKLDKYSKTLASVQRDSDILAGYIQQNWDHTDDTAFNPAFTGMVWAGPFNSRINRTRHRTEINRLSHIGVLLQQMDEKNNLTSLTYFGTNDDLVVTSKNITTTLNSIPSGFSNTERPWYRRAKNAGTTVWTNTYVDANTHELVTTVASPVYLDNGTLLGVVGFDVTLGVLSNDILETSPGFAFLLDSSGEAIVYPGMTAPNKTGYAERTFNGTNFLEDNVSTGLRSLAEDMVAGNKGLREVTIAGEKSYVAYGPITKNDWSVGVAVPVATTTRPVSSIENDLGSRLDKLNEKISVQTRTLKTSINQAVAHTVYRYVALFALIILIIAGLGIYVSTRITQPIIELHEKAESISKGGIGKELDIHTGDEIEALADSFNRIIRTIKILQKRDAPRDKYVTDQYNE